MNFKKGLVSISFRQLSPDEIVKLMKENMKYAKALSDRTVNIHVFNRSENKRYPLAEAVDLWKRYIECFDGSQALLLEFMPDDKPESLKAESEALRLIGGVR